MQALETIAGEIKVFLKSQPSIIITNHLNPDGDAVGSAIGLYGVLKTLGIKAKMLMPNDYAPNLKWMVHSEEVSFFDQDPEQGAQWLAQADLLIHLDYNDPKRSGPMANAIQASKAKKLMIDHHQQPSDFCDWTYSDTSMSSTCEMVFHFLKAMDWHDLVDKDLAEAIYTGIATDTGNFRFSSTSPTTHQVASILLAKGVESQKVASRVYDTNSFSRFQLLGRALNGMEVWEDLHTAVISLSAEDLQACHFVKGDTEGFVNYGLSLAGIEVAAFMMPRDGQLKLSFRSKTTFDVNQFARQYFKGGGHRNAAGGSSDGDISATKAKLLAALQTYKEELKGLADAH